MQIIKGKCADISSEGKGIIKTVYGVIFVDSLLLEEEAEIEVTYARAGISYGKIRRLITKSKDRISPPCPISTACGGCTFQNASYEYELIYKKRKVSEALRKIGHIDFPVNDVIGMEVPSHYRNKIQVPFARNGKNIIYGFYKANTHKIIPVKGCNIEDARAEPILSSIAYLMSSMKIEPYNEDNRSGIIRHLLIRTSYHYDEVMVVLVTNIDSFPSRNNFVKELVKKHPSIKTVVQNINSRDTNVILGEKERVLYGPGFIKDDILGLRFNISSKSFFQVNPIQTEKLYKTAINCANLTQNDVLLDAYSGVGTIGLICASKVKKVLSIEVVKEAVDNAISNAKNNHINNIEFINADCTEYIHNNLPKVDVVIMDPPRKGSTPEFLKALLEIKPSRIVYISCEPSTLARDLTYLINDYDIKLVQPVDMFPRGYHVETITMLNHK